MVLDIIKNTFGVLRDKFFNKEELDIKSKKFHTGKFILAIIISIIAALVVWEAFLIQRLAYKYHNLDFEHKKFVKETQMKEKDYDERLLEYRERLYFASERYRLIDKCLKEQGYKPPEFERKIKEK